MINFKYPKTIAPTSANETYKVKTRCETRDQTAAIAGTVGIGGGIYLVPLIIILGLGSAKEAAACGAVFIWVNSLSGLIARLQHNLIDITAFFSYNRGCFNWRVFRLIYGFIDFVFSRDGKMLGRGRHCCHCIPFKENPPCLTA